MCGIAAYGFCIFFFLFFFENVALDDEVITYVSIVFYLFLIIYLYTNINKYIYMSVYVYIYICLYIYTISPYSSRMSKYIFGNNIVK